MRSCAPPLNPLLSVLLLSACSSSDSNGREPLVENVLLVTVDTLRADHLGSYGHPGGLTPVLDELAGESRVFQYAYTQATHTHAALSSILTGLAPPRHGVLSQAGRLTPAALPLAVQLSAQGVATGVFIANVCKLREHRTVIQLGWDEIYCGMELDEDGRIVEGSEQYTWDRAITDAALEWIERQDGPWFAWVHYMDPHAEHRPQPDLWDYEERPITDKHSQYEFYGEYERASRRPEPEVIDTLWAQYAAEVRGTDREIGRLLDGVNADFERDELAVLFSVDHGEELFESVPRYGHGLVMTEGVLRVPLMVRAPGIEADYVTGMTQTLQVTPTVLELFDVAPPYAFDGKSLLADDPSSELAISYCGHVASARAGRQRVWIDTTESKVLKRSREIDSVLAQWAGLRATPWFRERLVLAHYEDDAPSTAQFVPQNIPNNRLRAQDMRRVLVAELRALGELPDPEETSDPALRAHLEDLGYFGEGDGEEDEEGR